MNPVEIKLEIERLEAVAAAKGYYLPKITLRLNWVGYELNADIEVRPDANATNKSEWIYATYEDGFAVLLQRVEAKINSLPSIEDAKRDAFIAAVGRLIDQGKDIGIDVKFLNPLTKMMEKLSTNIITKQSPPEPEMPF